MTTSIPNEWWVRFGTGFSATVDGLGFFAPAAPPGNVVPLPGAASAGFALLSRSDRTLLLLVHIEELPLASVSRLLEIPVTTLRRRLARATDRFERAYLGLKGVNHVRS